MDILLIRHGQSVANQNGLLISGESDDLTSLGRDQSKILADFISKKDLVPSTIFCSPWLRARSTAELVFPEKIDDFELDSRLAETNPGKYHDWLEKDFNEAFPDFYRDLSNKYENGESHLDMANRVCSWVDESIIPIKNAEGLVAVVSHGGPISVVLQYLLGMQIEEYYPSFTVPNASSSLLRWRDDLQRYVVIYIGAAA